MMWKVTLVDVVMSFLLIDLVSSTDFSRPNIVIFLVDDLGITDLGCFGNDTIQTPNIDRLAEEGARLIHDVHPDSVCTPNRAALLTGRYPIRLGLASDIDQLRMYVRTSTSGGLPRNEITIAEIASSAGYKTGMVGKWHLGLHLSSATDFHYHPKNQGFDHFYGLTLTNLRTCEPYQHVVQLVRPGFNITNILIAVLVIALTLTIGYLKGLLSKPAFIVLLLISLVMGTLMISYFIVARRFNCFIMKEFDVVEQPTILENLSIRFTDEAVNFIRDYKDGPFLLFMSYAKVHTALFNSQPFTGHSVHGRYGDNVEEMDWSVGQIMAAIDNLGLKEKTFVYFTSDNGPHLEEINSGEYHGGSKGIYKGGKGQSWDGGVRTPTIVSWPGHISGGKEVDVLTSTMDLLPTVARLVRRDIPGDRIIDGKNLLPLLTNEEQHSPHEFIFHYCGNQIHAVRYHPKESDIVWKAHLMTPKWSEGTDYCTETGLCLCHGDGVTIHEDPLLFDITNDPGESSPIAANTPEYQLVMSRISAAIDEHRGTIDSVPNQLEDDKTSFHPGLQMCCNFPFCTCKETRDLEHYPKL